MKNRQLQALAHGSAPDIKQIGMEFGLKQQANIAARLERQRVRSMLESYDAAQKGHPQALLARSWDNQAEEADPRKLGVVDGYQPVAYREAVRQPEPTSQAPQKILLESKIVTLPTSLQPIQKQEMKHSAGEEPKRPPKR